MALLQDFSSLCFRGGKDEEGLWQYAKKGKVLVSYNMNAALSVVRQRTRGKRDEIMGKNKAFSWVRAARNPFQTCWSFPSYTVH